MGALDFVPRNTFDCRTCGARMIDWQVFVLGVFACSIVMMAVRAIAREDQEARAEATARVAPRGANNDSVQPPN